MGRSIEKSTAPFYELVGKSCFSFLEGASHPEEMIEAARLAGYAGMALTDRNGVYGAPRAHVAAAKTGFALIHGAEVLLDGVARAILLARHRAGYGDLCELLTEVHAAHGVETKRLPSKSLLAKADGLCLLVPAFPPPELALADLRDAFGERFFVVASRHRDALDGQRTHAAERLAARYRASIVASNEPLFHERRRKPLQDVMSCIRHGCKLWEGGHRLLPNDERFVAPLSDLRCRYADRPEWLENTARAAAFCRFSLDEITYHYPSEWIPPGETGDSFLEKLVWQGAAARYPQGPSEAVVRQIRHELELIRELAYSDYFLTVWDIVQYARRNGILCQGRGSAANSIVCYLLGITALDPVRMKLLFERFLSRERKEPPDIDVDFEHERREEVIQYIYARYGRHRAAITAEVICYRRKSALREVAKVFDIPLSVVESFQTLTHREKLAAVGLEVFVGAAPQIAPRTLHQYLALAKALVGFPRHLGTHVGGFVLCHDALNRNVPVEAAAMADRTIVQWDKNDLDALGFVRVDVLGLGILTCTRKCLQLLKAHRGIDWDLSTIPAEDARVYDACCRGDTIGVFQIESRAQMNMLPRLKPRCFYDLVVEISLVRPGPIQGEMVHPYLRRRAGKEPIEYAHPDLKKILERTYGVPLFQEQIMKMAMEVAGFSPGEADALRRAMGAWRRTGNLLTPLGEKFRQGLLDRGIAREFADRVYQQIQGFAEYGFPESHAASFALIAYATAYLHTHFPDCYLVAILNSQPMGFYAKHTLIHDAERHGVKVLGIDVRVSEWDNTLESPGVARLGLREIKGLEETRARVLLAERARKPFASFADLVERWKTALGRLPLRRRDLMLLAGADAFQGLGLPRRRATWEIQALTLSDDGAFGALESETWLPKESRWESTVLDFDAAGVCVSQHPMALLRRSADNLGILPSRAVKRQPAKRRVRVAGMAISRQMPSTASGVLFMTLEDEFGFTNCIVWRDVLDRFRVALLEGNFLCCEGTIEKAEDGDVTHVIVETVALFGERQNVDFDSHDFH